MAGDAKDSTLDLPDGMLAQAEAIAGASDTHATSHQQSATGNLAEPATSDASSASQFNTPGLRLQGPDSSGADGLASEPPPPPYEGSYNSVNLHQDGLDTKADVASDGRVNIQFDQNSSTLSRVLVPALRRQLTVHETEKVSDLPPGYVPPSLGGVPGKVPPPPPMNVVIHVVGSRGDVQPFVALGKVLQKTYRHRVRLATHPVFRDFIEENGLEFFSIGGDPAELMAFMVKNPGLMPGKDALRSGDIGKRRKGMYDIVRGCWRSCFEAGDGTGAAVSDAHTSEDFDPNIKPFVADAIIANPPSFAHIHVAEKLGVPLHLMFTMPWSPTQAFPHPLANIQSSNADATMANFVSYAIVEMMTWQGLGDIINRFRETVLGLEPIELIRAPVLVSRLKVPYTYCWSPALIPKPQDWGHHISISGFYFLSLASNYHPAQDLQDFLNAGPPPVYIGFGSIVLDDPNGMTKLIFDAVKSTGQRALVSKGWGGVGADELGIPEGVFMLGNVPHDWLFKRVSCVVHHGGAGTTAAGIALSKPTVVVPFFGDQPFWGAMIAKAGAGPKPIPHKQLTAENLASAITEALRPETLERAQELGARIASEQGCDVGAKSFHDPLDVESMRCSLAPSRVAIWQVKKTNIRLSGLAAAILGKEGLLDFNQLRLYRYKEYDTEDGPWEPISGGASALLGTISGLMMGVADVPVDVFKSMSNKSSKKGTEEIGTKPTGSKSNDQTAESQQTPVGSSRDTQGLSTDAPGSTLNHGEGQEGKEPRSTSSTSRPRSASRSPSGVSEERKTISLGDAVGAGKGFGRVVDAGIKSPMDFTLALAKGFHNAPRLYGDKSVRPHDHISGFQSGIKAAGKEFGFGFYDGISGLVTQPLEGAKKEGFSGLAKGFAKGIGGVVFKPAAAIWGLPGYTFKGLYKELSKRMGSSVQNYIVAARIAQGYGDLASSNPEERLDIARRWQALQGSSEKPSKRSPFGFAKPSPNPAGHNPGGNERDGKTWIESAGEGSDDKEFADAIKQSVAATSTGNEEEDRMIAEAIEASVAELRQAAREGRGGDALQKAIDTSIVESGSTRPKDPSHKDDDPNPSSEFDLASNRSRGVYDGEQSRQRDDPKVESDDDENFKQAIEKSKQESRAHGSYDDELDRAIAESLHGSAKQEDEKASKAEEEERIVMEYVKRQSLLEEEHRKARTQ